MKLGCHCGALIVDQTDALPHKAHILVDQDWFDLMETIHEMPVEVIRSMLWSRTRIAYQCRECGRIFVDDKSRTLHSFAPDSDDVPRDLFTK